MDDEGNIVLSERAQGHRLNANEKVLKVAGVFKEEGLEGFDFEYELLRLRGRFRQDPKNSETT